MNLNELIGRMLHAQTNGGKFRDAHEVLHYLGADFSRMIKAVVTHTDMANVVFAADEGDVEMHIECDGDAHVLTLSSNAGPRRLVITLTLVEDTFPTDVIHALGKLGIKVS